MLLVKTKIGPSKINGTGLFADQFIPKGSPVWRWMPDFDLRVTEAELGALSGPAKETYVKYAYFSRKSNRFVLCFDDARFINHSESPNLQSVPNSGDEDMDIAAVDIHPGDEITCNYVESDSICLNYPDALKGLESRS